MFWMLLFELFIDLFSVSWSVSLLMLRLAFVIIGIFLIFISDSAFSMWSFSDKVQFVVLFENDRVG